MKKSAPQTKRHNAADQSFLKSTSFTFATELSSKYLNASANIQNKLFKSTKCGEKKTKNHLQVGRSLGSGGGGGSLFWEITSSFLAQVRHESARSVKNNAARTAGSVSVILRSGSPSPRNRARVPPVPPCVRDGVPLDGRGDLLPPGSGLGGEFPGVPAGLLVHEPGVPGPNEHVEETEHLRGGGGGWGGGQ